MAGEFVRVAALEDIVDPGLLGVRLPSGLAVCLMRNGDAVTATRDTCTHQAFPLSEGDIEDGKVICAWHGAEFDCLSGRVKRGPADDDLELLAVKVDAGAIWVRQP